MKAMALLSGGLDSTLAAKIVANEGIDVVGLTCTTPFSSSLDAARRSAAQIGVPVLTVELEEDYYAIVRSPRFGYGKNLNPCIDCKILMLARARKLLAETGASFVVTGEVVGQRPKSQFRDALARIDRESGLDGLILRPLSARILPETIPEREGWIRRDALLAISGRTRTAQLEMARRLGITEFTSPAGGCLLTDPGYCARLKDLMAIGVLAPAETEMLKCGRHFRLSPGYRLIVGRNERENARIEELALPDDVLIMPADAAGPTAVGRGSPAAGDLDLSARIVARYCSTPAAEVDLLRRDGPTGAPAAVRAAKAAPTEYEHLRL